MRKCKLALLICLTNAIIGLNAQAFAEDVISRAIPKALFDETNKYTVEFHVDSDHQNVFVELRGVKFVNLSGPMVNAIIPKNDTKQQLQFWIHGYYGHRHGYYNVSASLLGSDRRPLADVALGRIGDLDCFSHDVDEIRLPPVDSPVDLRNVKMIDVKVSPDQTLWCDGEPHPPHGVFHQALVDVGNGVEATWDLLLSKGVHDDTKTQSTNNNIDQMKFIYDLRYWCRTKSNQQQAEARMRGSSSHSMFLARQDALGLYLSYMNNDLMDACKKNGYQMGFLLPSDMQDPY